MNPQRIEEFRKKLRAGQPARVRGGLVEIEGAAPENAAAPPPNAQATPAGAPAPLAVPSPLGVQVKPHEWGAR